MKGIVWDASGQFIINLFLPTKDHVYLTAARDEQLALIREGLKLVMFASVGGETPVWRGTHNDYTWRCPVYWLDVPEPAQGFKFSVDAVRGTWGGAPALFLDIPEPLLVLPTAPGRMKVHPMDTYRMARRVREGEPVEAVAREYGISREQLTKILRGGRSDTPGLIPVPDRRRRPHTAETRAKMSARQKEIHREPSARTLSLRDRAADLLGKGLSYRAIAANLGVSQPYVRHLIARFNLKKGAA
jgi:DNA-binding CsgD family transcriptional regulator